MPFKKGQSGNPSGRKPKTGALREIEAVAKQHGGKAIDKILALMDSPDERVAFSASQAMLDRGFGKPAQAITGSDGGPLTVVLRKFSDV